MCQAVQLEQSARLTLIEFYETLMEMKGNQINVILTIECFFMLNPKRQRSRFDEAMTDAYWELLQHKEAVKDGVSAVSTVTEWSKAFNQQKPVQKIVKSTQNLIKRAATYAGIPRVSSSIEINHQRFELCKSDVKRKRKPNYQG